MPSLKPIPTSQASKTQQFLNDLHFISYLVVLSINVLLQFYRNRSSTLKKVVFISLNENDILQPFLSIFFEYFHKRKFTSLQQNEVCFYGRFQKHIV
jgi:hypothetical protein